LGVTGGNLALSTQFVSYKNVSLAGVGIPMIVAAADLTARSAVGTICTYIPGTTGTFMIGGYLNVTAIATNTIQFQVSYTDENSNSTVVTFQTSGAIITTVLGTITATGNNSFFPLQFRCKGGSAITVQTANIVSAGSNTFDVGASIIQIS
jgi:hypothetical protein